MDKWIAFYNQVQITLRVRNEVSYENKNTYIKKLQTVTNQRYSKVSKLEIGDGQLQLTAQFAVGTNNTSAELTFRSHIDILR